MAPRSRVAGARRPHRPVARPKAPGGSRGTGRDVVLDLGWGRLVFGNTFADQRGVLEALYAGPLPTYWDDTEAVLRGTGRLRADDPRLPLLG